MKTQIYFHPLQSDKFKAGMDRIRMNEKKKRILDSALEFGHVGYRDIFYMCRCAFVYYSGGSLDVR